MKKNIVAPLVLLSSLTLLTSCMTKKDATPVVPAPTQSATQVDVVTTNPTPAPTETVTPTPAPTEPTTGSSSVTPTAQASVITRTETVSYKNPSGSDEVEFSVTVTDGVITAASATPKAENEISKKLQTAFAGGVSAKVVGMKAKDLDVDAIGGASLTTAAFETFAHSF
jgi:uncharacterized protein with FMN-binding domain